MKLDIIFESTTTNLRQWNSEPQQTLDSGIALRNANIVLNNARCNREKIRLKITTQIRHHENQTKILILKQKMSFASSRLETITLAER